MRPIGELVEDVKTWDPSALTNPRPIRYIDLSSVDKDAKTIVPELVAEVMSNEAPSRARQLVAENDVLVSTVRPNLNGVALVEAGHDGATASTGYCVLRPDAHKLDPKYLKYWVTSKAFVDEMTRLATGASYPAVSDATIKASKIPYVPLPTQRRIAAVLDKAQALVANDKRTLALYDQLARSLFLEMFGDPVRNERGWEVVKLEDICGVASSKRVFVEELVDSGIPFYRGTEIGMLGEGIDVAPTLFITEEHYARLKEHSGIPKPGDLLMPSICPDGRIHIVADDSPFYFKDGRVLWVQVDESKVSSAFLRSLLRSLFNANYAKIASGTTFAELKIVALKKLMLPLPPIKSQQAFAKAINKMNEQRARAEQSLRQSEALFGSLLQGAFNGNIK